MESELLQLILSQTGLGGIAFLALWLVNKAWADALRRERENVEQMRADRAEYITVMRELTKALANLENAVEQSRQYYGRPPAGN